MIVQPQQLFLGGIVKGIKKAVSGVGKAVGSIVVTGIVQTLMLSFIPGAGPIWEWLMSCWSCQEIPGQAGLSKIPGVSGTRKQVGGVGKAVSGGIASNLLGGNFAGAITGGLNLSTQH